MDDKEKDRRMTIKSEVTYPYSNITTKQQQQQDRNKRVAHAFCVRSQLAQTQQRRSTPQQVITITIVDVKLAFSYNGMLVFFISLLPLYLHLQYILRSQLAQTQSTASYYHHQS